MAMLTPSFLRPSNPPLKRVFFQLHPGESIFIGPLTISIVPSEHSHLPVLSSPLTGSRYGSYVRQVSQGLASVEQEHSSITLMEARSVFGLSTPNRKRTAKVSDKVASQSRPRLTPHMDNVSPAMTVSTHKGSHETPESEYEVQSSRSFEKETDAISKPQIIDLLGSNESDSRSEQTALMKGKSRVSPIYPRKRKEMPLALKALPDTGSWVQTLSQERPQRHTKGSQDNTQESILSSVRVKKNDADSRIAEQFIAAGPKTRSKAIKETPSRRVRGNYVRWEDEVSWSSEGVDRSTRATAQEDAASRRDSRQSSGTKIIFANSSIIGGSRSFVSFLKKNKVEVVDSVQDCDTLCVGKGALKKTAKLLAAVLLGKAIVKDEWVSASAQHGHLLDKEAYLASDPAKEAEWGVSLREAVQRGRHHRQPLGGWNVVVTQALKKTLGKKVVEELKELSLMAGVQSFSSALPKKSMQDTPPTLLIATQDDPATQKLDRSWRCYSHDIISISILRGTLDTESDEYQVWPSSDIHKPRGRKRKRSSVSKSS